MEIHASHDFGIPEKILHSNNGTLKVLNSGNLTTTKHVIIFCGGMCDFLCGKPLGSTSCQRSWISVKPRESWWKTLPNPSCSAILLPEQCNLRRGSSKLDNHGGSDGCGEIVVVDSVLTLRMSFCKPCQIEIFIYHIYIYLMMVITQTKKCVHKVDWWMGMIDSSQKAIVHS